MLAQRTSAGLIRGVDEGGTQKWELQPILEIAIAQRPVAPIQRTSSLD